MSAPQPILNLIQRFEQQLDPYALEREIASIDAQIDRLVYGLYGPTEDEIKIVEEAAK